MKTVKLHVSEGSDYTQITSLLKESKALLHENSGKSYQFAHEALMAARKHKSKPLIAASLVQKGKVYAILGQNQNAIIDLKEAIHIYTELDIPHKASDAYKSLGTVYKNMGEYTLALDNYQRSLRFDPENPTALANIGNLYKYLNNFGKAIEYLERSIQLYNPDVEDISIKAGRLINLATTHLENDSLDIANKLLEEAKGITEKINHKSYRALCEANIGLIRIEEKKYHEAQQLLSSSLDTFQELNNNTGEQIALHSLARIHKQSGDSAKAAEFLVMSLLLAKKIQSKNSIIHCYQELTEVYENLGDYKQALSYHKLYSEEKSKIINRNKFLKIAELETKDAVEKLEIRNRQLVQEKEELKYIKEETEQFAYVIAHDLREPLNTISNFSRLLYTQEGKYLSAEGKQFYSFIESSVLNMDVMIKNLLDFARVGKTGYTEENVSLDQVLKKVKEVLAFTIREQGVRIMSTELPVLRANEALLSQLIQNIISNAIKFTEDNTSQVIIKSKPKGKFHQISIKDNGIGIPESELESVFDLFYKAKNTENYQGSGIGLATCKKIVEKFGGKIWIESLPEQGSTFHFTLPKA